MYKKLKIKKEAYVLNIKEKICIIILIKYRKHSISLYYRNFYRCDFECYNR